jgi:prevent-host-death family protein
MKKMAAGSFKTHCLAVLDEVQAKHETVVITKHGKPVAKLFPVATLPQRKPKISIAFGLV